MPSVPPAYRDEYKIELELPSLLLVLNLGPHLGSAA